MKRALLFLSLVLFFQQTKSQCIQSATNFGNNTDPSYEVTGDVTVTLNTDDTITLDLGTNFMTSHGPDVRAYLVNSNELSDVNLSIALIANLENIEFGIVSSDIPFINEDGAKSFTVPIPNDKNIEDFDRIFFYCLQFDAFWDFSPFTSFTSSNCNLLSLENNDIDKITIYPNPARDIIHLKGLTDNETEIRIFDIFGKLAYSQNKNIKDIDVSQLNAGIYLLSISNQGRRTTQKLVIQ